MDITQQAVASLQKEIAAETPGRSGWKARRLARRLPARIQQEKAARAEGQAKRQAKRQEALRAEQEALRALPVWGVAAKRGATPSAWSGMLFGWEVKQVNKVKGVTWAEAEAEAAFRRKRDRNEIRASRLDFQSFMDDE